MVNRDGRDGPMKETATTRPHGLAGDRRGAAARRALASAIVLFSAVGTAGARTIATHYSYNADGALTAVAKTADGNTETTYVTWDNFVPDAEDPTTGTLRRGNGTMDGFGPSPGAAQFEFDARNRLVSYRADGVDESYAYRADGMMASSSAAGDTRRFYYEDSENPQVTNIHQDGSGLWSAYLDEVRYLSDGAEQALFQPRKDVACTYDPQSQELQSYNYDAFGSQSQAPLQSAYDLHDNPFQYSGEYREPLWGGVYLRARWYDPDLPVFLSRDPTAQLNRYGYGGGNPVMRVDPSGMNFFHSLGRDLRAANAFMNKGIGGHFARLFLAPALGALSLAADPKGFWESLEHNKAGMTAFLIAGVVVEGFSIGAEGFGLSELIRTLSLTTRFTSRLLVDSGLAIGQAVAAGADNGWHHFNWESFAQNAELGLGGLVYSRGALGIGYNPYTLKGIDVAKMAGGLAEDKVLFFRERTPLMMKVGITSPLSEQLKTSMYHERIVAVSKDGIAASEVTVDDALDLGYMKRTSKGSAFRAVRKDAVPFDLKA